MTELVKQHDELAKRFLTDLNAARGFLQIHLDPKILAKCDLSTLTIESGSYIDNDLRKRASDILYKMDLLDKSNCVYVYVLIEHQSRAEELMPLRVLRYVLAILQNHVDKYKVKGDLPIVVPLILYNGEKSPYPYATNISKLFEDKELIKEFPVGSFRLVDLTVMPDEAIYRHGKIALLEMLQKHINVRDFRKSRAQIVHTVLVAYKDNISKELFDSAISYLTNAREGFELEPLFKEIIDNISEYEGTIMSYAEELEQKGIQKGMQKGRQEAEQEIAKNLLKSGVDAKVVANATHLSVQQINELKKSMH
ncbi:MAG: hypothetical protein QG673_43 [Pseudomonadota bacterium]|nr:hypothetical protein [Pseudomonadota bacterium]